jgi:hypothetical protein
LDLHIINSLFTHLFPFSSSLSLEFGPLLPNDGLTFENHTNHCHKILLVVGKIFLVHDSGIDKVNFKPPE